MVSKNYDFTIFWLMNEKNSHKHVIKNDKKHFYIIKLSFFQQIWVLEIDIYTVFYGETHFDIKKNH